MRHSSVFLLSLFVVLASSCAKQGYPSGGPRDVQPPVAVGSKPANALRNFDRQGFYVEFDEYVVLKNANENVLVSPPLKQKPEYTVKGKGVQVSWTDTLQPNTTYLFQFKDAVADFTEGNLMPSFEYVFSTGPNMDTLMLAGSTADARSGKPWAESLSVLAYRAERFTADSTDTIARFARPDYVTRTDRQGRFAFHYIPAGRYRLVAFDDKNRDLRLGLAEAAAWDTAFFAADSVVDSSAMPTLRVSVPDRRVQRLLKAEFTGKGRIVVSTALPMQQPSLTGDSLVMRLGASADTLTVWLADEQKDSARLVLVDPSGLADTLRLKYREATRGRRGRGQTQQKAAEPLVKALCAGQAAYYDDLRLAFRNPVAAVADSLVCTVMLLKDSSLTSAPIVVDTDGMGARIMATLRSGERYTIRLRDSLFTDIYGHPSDSLKIDLTPKDYGTLKLHVDNRLAHPLVVEVLDKRDTVVRQLSTLQSPLPTLVFDHLPAGEYRLRAVADADSNGRWTPGDYLGGRQPEEMFLFEKTLQLREKWEMEERWTVGNRKVDEQHSLKKMEKGRLEGGFDATRKIESPRQLPKR